MSDIHLEETPVNFPTWTDYQETQGQDPLGMQNSSISLYQTLLPGIGNATLRIRYFGFYAWICRSYGQYEGSEDPQEWKRFIRRAEALLALTAHHVGTEHGVAGIQWAARAYSNEDVDRIDFASAADPGSDDKYLQQAWGIYGAAYRSQLFDNGIFWESPQHSIPVPSTNIGDRLADVFAQSLGHLAARVIDIVMRGTVTKEELDLVSLIVPSKIEIEGAERDVYEEILLRPESSEDTSAISRRLSVQLILNVTSLLGRDPTPNEVRWVLYAGQDQQGRPLELVTDALMAQRNRWWVYHANDMCHVAMETLLKFALDALAPFQSGLRLERLIPLCTDRILEVNDVHSLRWSEFLELIDTAGSAYAAADDSSEWSLCHSIVNKAGRTHQSNCPPEIAWKAIVLLAMLQKRVEQEDHPVEEELRIFDADYYQTLLTVVRFLRRYADEPIFKLLGRLIEQKVIRRHLWVATRKLRGGGYTFLFDSDEGRLRLRGKDGPVFTNPRLSPAITFLRDIHLISNDGLTHYGEAAIVDI